MRKLKLYSKYKPVEINGIYPLFAEIYIIDINGTKNDSVWYAELEIDDYKTTRLELEKNGYTAHPASIREIESKEYNIFKF